MLYALQFAKIVSVLAISIYGIFILLLLQLLELSGSHQTCKQSRKVLRALFWGLVLALTISVMLNMLLNHSGHQFPLYEATVRLFSMK